MKVIAALDADLETTPLGTVSRMAEPLGDDTVLGMTVRRLTRCKRLQGVYVLIPSDQYARAMKLLEGTSALLRKHEAGCAPHRRLIRVARKWSLDGWRGGIGGATAMDEYVNPPLLAGLVKQESADAVFFLPAAAPLIDPELADAMVEHFCSVSDEMRMTFAQAPPGLTGTIFQSELLRELAEKCVPPGWTMSYKPDTPGADLATRKCCFQVCESLRHAGDRLIADTRRSTERIRRCLEAHPDPNAETVGRWLIAQEAEHVPELPREVEIELTTEDQLGSTILRPRGAQVRRNACADGGVAHGFSRGGHESANHSCPPPLKRWATHLVGQRGPIEVDVVRRIAAELAAYDDSLVVLGGFGEPLLHPRLDEILGVLREAGIYGIALRTNGIALADEAIETIIRHEVDVVSITLDAACRETYAKVHGSDAFETVVKNIERLVAARHGKPANQPSRPPTAAPLVVPEMVKCRETVAEMDKFFDGWIRKVGWAVVAGYNCYGGRLEDRSVVDMTPPNRTACRRIRTRCMVTADAGVLLCDQDFAAERPVGNLGSATLGELWRGSAFDAARHAHARGRYEDVCLCERCQEWHRP
ncbi:MAG: radical SAM protein [Phycisphaerae bacterium]|nr:radical SAM protein [Phycisphaerae bacterium]